MKLILKFYIFSLKPDLDDIALPAGSDNDLVVSIFGFKRSYFDLQFRMASI